MSLIFFSILSIFSDDNHPTPNNLSFWVLCIVFKCNFRVAFLISSEYSWILEQKLQHSFLHLLLPEKLLFGIKRAEAILSQIELIHIYIFSWRFWIHVLILEKDCFIPKQFRIFDQFKYIYIIIISVNFLTKIFAIIFNL